MNSDPERAGIHSQAAGGTDPSATNGRWRRRTRKRLLALVVFTIFSACAGTQAIAEIWPALGAQLADQVRDWFGPSVVARIETVVFEVQDTLKLWSYQVSGRRADPPWAAAGAGSGQTPGAAAAGLVGSPAQQPSPHALAPAAPSTAAAELEELQQELLRAARRTPTPGPDEWSYPLAVPFGSVEGEGVWQPYLYDRQGNVVALRTFLQPDTRRPYAIVAVVAFDLRRTRLHFVLGFNEPALPGGPRGKGQIPEEDLQEGVLLAAFNGGFKAANGQFGAMAEGITALPPKGGMATVGIYNSGEIRIGSWGEEIDVSPDLEAWRQNCRLVIQGGVISPRVYNDSIVDWGGSIHNQIVTRRSGLGLDLESRTLYYFAGPSLSMPVLADAMLAVGVHNGMLLDINNFWVLFTAFRPGADGLVAEPLLPDEMRDRVDRYLGPSPADFFYITLREDEQP